MIEDFWKLDQTNYDKLELKKGVEFHYSEEFIEYYDKWKIHLDDFNNDIKQSIKDIVPEDMYIEMKYDILCKKIIDQLLSFIDLYGRLGSKDIVEAVKNIKNDHIAENINNYNIKYLSINGLKQSIKKIVAV